MLVEVKNYTKRIRRKLILDHVSLTLNNRKIYGLQGPNGSGKTMLLRAIAGLIVPTEGNVKINDIVLGSDVDFPPSMGMLIENPAFIGNYTGRQNLTLLAEIKQICKKKDIDAAINRVGLDPDDKRHYSKYSLGMKQRLGIAAAIMEKPELILLDEPTNALDEKGIRDISNIICEEKERGALIVIASHDASFLAKIADEIFAVSEGKVSL